MLFFIFDYSIRHQCELNGIAVVGRSVVVNQWQQFFNALKCEVILLFCYFAQNLLFINL